MRGPFSVIICSCVGEHVSRASGELLDRASDRWATQRSRDLRTLRLLHGSNLFQEKAKLKIIRGAHVRKDGSKVKEVNEDPSSTVGETRLEAKAAERLARCSDGEQNAVKTISQSKDLLGSEIKNIRHGSHLGEVRTNKT